MLSRLLCIFSVAIGMTEAAPVHATYGARPTIERSNIGFMANQGQWHPEVLFRADAARGSVWITKTGLVYQFVTAEPASISQGTHHPDMLQLLVQTTFKEANHNPSIEFSGQRDYRISFFTGQDPARWRTDVPVYSEIVYRDIYPGTDLRLYDNDGNLEYDFVLSPNSDLDQIEIVYSGVAPITVTDDGALLIPTNWGHIRELSPFSYQVANGKQVPVRSQFDQRSDSSFGFVLADTRDPNTVTVIDPVVDISTFIGGSLSYEAYDIALDSSGMIFITGYTASSDFPLENAYDSTYGGSRDAFISCFAPGGAELVFSTYLGGSAEDIAYGIAVGPAGNVFVAGITRSTNFPLLNQYGTGFNGGISDIFVTKLSASGNTLIYSTFLGGSGSDEALSLAVDTFGAAYIAGVTTSSNYPTVSAIDFTFNGIEDGYITKLSPAGNSLAYSSYLGGSQADRVNAIDVDLSGKAYVTGYTGSSNFYLYRAYDNSYNGNQDTFVTKIEANGKFPVYSTYLGGTAWDQGNGITHDADGNAYVIGSTGSNDFPKANAYDSSFNGGIDIFVTKLSSSGAALTYSTFLGGAGCPSDDRGKDIAVDSNGYAYLTGWTTCSTFPILNAIDRTHNGGWDIFVTKPGPLGKFLYYSTFYGDLSDDAGNAIVLDSDGNAYVAGYTLSCSFPMVNPFDTICASGANGVFFRVANDGVNNCCIGSAGNVNGDTEDLDVADLVYLVEYFFGTPSGPEPPCPAEADIDGSSTLDIADMVYLVGFMFGVPQGPEPVICPEPAP